MAVAFDHGDLARDTWLAGWIYDTTGSYAWLVIPSGVATAVAGLIMWYLPSRRLA